MNVVLSGSFDTAQLPRIAGDPVTVTVARTIRPGYEAEFPFEQGDDGTRELRAIFRARDGRFRIYPVRTFTWGP